MKEKTKLLLVLLFIPVMMLCVAQCSAKDSPDIDNVTIGDSSVSDDEVGNIDPNGDIVIYEDPAPLDEYQDAESEIPKISDTFPADYFPDSEDTGFSVRKTDSTVTVKGTASFTEIEKIFERVNKERRDAGLTELQYDTTLQAGALQRSAEITVTWSHTRPDGSAWKSVADKVNGENIAYGYRDAKAVMDGWMKSEGHRANILKSDFTRIGIGAVEVNGTMYWVQLFGF